MTRHDEQFSCNSSQVRDAERRLAVQHVFIERLRASGNDTRSAEKALEVMRDILRELYCARSLLRRKGVPREGAPTRRRASERPRAGASGPTRHAR
jgi:hypothetical protein